MNNKNVHIVVKTTKEERREFHELAKSKGFDSLSQYIRYLLRNQNIGGVE